MTTKPIKRSGFNQGIWAQSATAKEGVGTLRICNNGDGYRYAKNGGTALAWDERIQWDVYYVHRGSLWMDLKILLRTLLSVLAKPESRVRRFADVHPDLARQWGVTGAESSP